PQMVSMRLEGGMMPKATEALAALMITAIIVACGGSSKNFGSVTGRVIDSRSHKPVVGARVSDGVGDAQTDSTGRFALREVPKISRLVVSARNYRDASASPSLRESDIGILPLPTKGAVR